MEDAKGMLLAILILLSIIGLALMLGDSSSNAPADPQCVSVGNC